MLASFLAGVGLVAIVLCLFSWNRYRQTLIQLERRKTEEAEHEAEKIAKQRDIAAGPRKSLSDIERSMLEDTL